MDITIILSTIGTIATVAAIVGTAMYKLGDRLARIEKDVESLRRDVDELKRDVNELKAGVGELRIGLTNVQRDVGELRRAVNGLGDFLANLVEKLSGKGVLEDANLLKTALRNMTNTVTNPLTSEERKRLLELIDKGEDMTPEEADELVRLARKFFREYGGKVENAWLMLYYAGAIRGMVYGKHSRKLTPILD
jgi:polyhydroxyalkanoate synthesis regulator phasin